MGRDWETLDALDRLAQRLTGEVALRLRGLILRLAQRTAYGPADWLAALDLAPAVGAGISPHWLVAVWEQREAEIAGATLAMGPPQAAAWALLLERRRHAPGSAEYDRLTAAARAVCPTLYRLLHSLD